MRDDDGAFRVERRTVLKSAAVAAVGAGAFSGTASANVPEQINFCGCSQVCVCDDESRADGGMGNYQVIIAREPYNEEDFEIINENGEGYQLASEFCYELSEEQLSTGYKIAGVRGAQGGKTRPRGGRFGRLWPDRGLRR